MPWLVTCKYELSFKDGRIKVDFDVLAFSFAAAAEKSSTFADGEEVLGLEGGTADQTAVDILSLAKISAAFEGLHEPP